MTGSRSTPRTRMSGMLKTPRSRGLLNGLLLTLLALWGGFIPFVGPYFDFGFGSGDAWVYNSDRLVLSILPAVAVFVGGLFLLASANRPVAVLGSWLAALGGLWFVVGTTIAPLWNAGAGRPLGGQTRQIAEQLSFFQGLGAVVIMLAAVALGRFLVVGVREARRAEAGQVERERAAPAEDRAHGSTAAPQWEDQERPRHDGRQPAGHGGHAGPGAQLRRRLSGMGRTRGHE
ncbi:hypothetical protein [Actinomadura opuntiae]|uniref:hypothetical protein n=1 Tax=Actinomadura sp. OS1-43 TaxID=604315 RepID=UPI00255B3F5D|nr:hypothetical protein [Actinomadura sp. OS1-43]MDL4815248.1 hypothetical protein [Actinomadura sp. OS1-43]